MFKTITKVLTVALATATLTLIFSSCGCKHEWIDATCTTPKTCSLCQEIEGEANGHNWLDATCTAAKSCKNCDTTEGEALGHDWLEATTEDPITCSRCKVTEGTRLITDPRFTTASTKEFYGKWQCETILPSEYLEELGIAGAELPVTVLLEFTNVGDMKVRIEFENVNDILNIIADYSRTLIYNEFTAMGISEEQADEAMLSVYGMTIDEYIDQTLDSFDLDFVLDQFKTDEVYYVGQNGIYSADSWYGEFEPSEYTFEGDTLTIDELKMIEDSEPLVFTKVK